MWHLNENVYAFTHKIIKIDVYAIHQTKLTHVKLKLNNSFFLVFSMFKYESLIWKSKEVCK